MSEPIAVITARGGSRRIPRKNMLLLGGKNLVQWSLLHAKQAGLHAALSSDCPEILRQAVNPKECTPIHRPDVLSGGDRHLEAIKHAVELTQSQKPELRGGPVVLLQPTSPFRNGDIIQRCLRAWYANPDKVVYSGRELHYADANGVNFDKVVWDGCVAVFPPNNVAHTGNSIVVENEHGNMLQIDTEQDYLLACVQYWRHSGSAKPYTYNDGVLAVNRLRPLVSGKKVTLVGRPDGLPYDDSHPIAYLNHCVGYDGGRADILFIIACNHTKKVGITPQMREVAQKASVVIVRNLGISPWLLSALPEAQGKTVVLNGSSKGVTTGSIASLLLHAAGGLVERVGFQHGLARLDYLKTTGLLLEASDELAFLEFSGVSRLPQK